MSDGAYGWFHRAWYERAPGYQLFVPLSLAYWLVVTVRRFLYRVGLLKAFHLPVPVIVVGNVVAGGAGKTPVTLYLAEQLSRMGYKPGIVSRGYGRVDDALLEVGPDTTASEAGDEPLLLARRSGCPVVVSADRVAAGRKLVDQGVDLVIADDGLQHYRLGRDIEICVVDGERGFGNGWLIPAGPLRETRSRAKGVDALLINGRPADSSLAPVRDQAMIFTLEASEAERLDGTVRRPLESFQANAVHAVAGIGNPGRFFTMLEAFGLSVIAHPFRDHAALTLADLDFGDERDVLMTEKDAVKLPRSDRQDLWSVPVSLAMDAAQSAALLAAIDQACGEKRESPS